ncbi:MAG: transposase [bacterium]|nr:transposase [bacterium]
MEEAGKKSHQQACSSNDKRYEGMRVVLVDGTKIIVPRTDETITTYGLGSGSTGNAYYPQIHAGGFFELVTGTFADVNFDHGDPAERQIMLEHARDNQESTLYVGDAGYNPKNRIKRTLFAGHSQILQEQLVS